MIDMAALMGNMHTAMVAADADMKVIYANPRCKAMFKRGLGVEDFVGRDLGECHSPETMDKVRDIYQQFQEKTLGIHHYARDAPGGKLTIVQVPVYDNGRFSGVVEFIFESDLS